MKKLSWLILGVFSAVCCNILAASQPWIYGANFLPSDGGNHVNIQIQYQTCDKNLKCISNVYTSDFIPADGLGKISYGWYNKTDSIDIIKVIKASAYLDGTYLYSTDFNNSCYAPPTKTINFTESSTNAPIICQIDN